MFVGQASLYLLLDSKVVQYHKELKFLQEKMIIAPLVSHYNTTFIFTLPFTVCDALSILLPECLEA